MIATNRSSSVIEQLWFIVKLITFIVCYGTNNIIHCMRKRVLNNISINNSSKEIIIYGSLSISCCAVAHLCMKLRRSFLRKNFII